MTTTELQSPLRPEEVSAGFAAAVTDDGFRSEAERLYECGDKAGTAQAEWLHYCVQNHLI